MITKFMETQQMPVISLISTYVTELIIQLYYQNYRMRQSFGREILIKTLQLIMQNRVQINKKQIRKFDEIYREIKNNTYPRQLDQLVQHIVKHERFGVRERLSHARDYHRVEILFELVEVKTKLSTITELWLIDYDQYNNFEEQDSNQQFRVISHLFEQLLFLLNQQPMFCCYHRNPKFRKQYTIKHTINISGPESQQFHSNQNTIDCLRHKYIRQRITKSLIINICCASLPKLDDFWQITNNPSIGIKTHNKKNEASTIDNSFKQLSSTQLATNRTISYYQFHDHELEFIFLSSHDEQLPVTGVSKIQLEEQLQQSEQFELLVIDKDHELILELQDEFTQLLLKQVNYLFH